MKIEKMDIILDRDNKEEHPPVKFEFVKQLKNRENRRLGDHGLDDDDSLYVRYGRGDSNGNIRSTTPPPPPNRIIKTGFRIPKKSTIKAFLLTFCVPLFLVFGVFYIGKLSTYLSLFDASQEEPTMVVWIFGLIMTLVVLLGTVFGYLIFILLKTLFEDLKDRFEE